MATNGNLPPNNNVNSTTEYFNNYFSDRFTTSPNINDAVIGYFQSVTGDADSGKALAATVIYTALSQGLEPMSLVDEFKKLKAGRRVEVKTPIASNSVNDSYTTYDQIVAHKNEYPVGQLFYVPASSTFYRSYYAEIPVDQPLVIQTTFDNPIFDANTISIQQQQILMGQPQLDTIYTPSVPGYVDAGIPFYAADDIAVGDTIVGNVELISGNSFVDTTYTTPVEYTVPSELENPNDYIVKTYLDQSIKIEAIQGYKRETVSLGSGQYEYNYFYVSYTQEQDEITPYLTVLLNQNRVNTSLLGISNTPAVNKYVQRAILA
jgi:hypothetical protein